MIQIRTLSLLLLLAIPCLAGSKPEKGLDRNTAFYKGESLNYVIYPPDGYRMVDLEATGDGYSFAFIPTDEEYNYADLMIGVNIFKIRGLKFSEVVDRDTASIRKHYGKQTRLWAVDSLSAASGQPVWAFFINDTSRFIPNVMLGYVDGRTEMLVFELVITDRVARVKAEDVFVQCVRRLRVLPAGELGQKYAAPLSESARRPRRFFNQIVGIHRINLVDRAIHCPVLACSDWSLSPSL